MRLFTPFYLKNSTGDSSGKDCLKALQYVQYSLTRAAVQSCISAGDLRGRLCKVWEISKSFCSMGKGDPHGGTVCVAGENCCGNLFNCPVIKTICYQLFRCLPSCFHMALAGISSNTVQPFPERYIPSFFWYLWLLDLVFPNFLK